MVNYTSNTQATLKQSMTSAKQLNYSDIVQQVLSASKSIRFCGVVDKLGYIVYKKYRADIKQPILTEQENERYALITTMRRRPNLPWREKVGQVYYFALRTEKFVQTTIPISDNYLLLVYFESDSKFDKIIVDKLVPMLEGFYKGTALA